jgi:hypothetical protein
VAQEFFNTIGRFEPFSGDQLAVATGEGPDTRGGVGSMAAGRIGGRIPASGRPGKLRSGIISDVLVSGNLRRKGLVALPDQENSQ